MAAHGCSRLSSSHFALIAARRLLMKIVPLVFVCESDRSRFWEWPCPCPDLTDGISSTRLWAKPVRIKFSFFSKPIRYIFYLQFVALLALEGPFRGPKELAQGRTLGLRMLSACEIFSMLLTKSFCSTTLTTFGELGAVFWVKVTFGKVWIRLMNQQLRHCSFC